MNILIIGGNRFVGKLIAKKLIPTHNITIINRKGTGPEGCTILKVDRNNTLEFVNKLSNLKFDIVIDMCLYNPEQCLIIDKLFLGKISKYIFMSSIASKMDGFGEYGVNKKKILFVTLARIDDVNLLGIYSDLLKKFHKEGH